MLIISCLILRDEVLRDVLEVGESLAEVEDFP
jgi:hypothetical protein